MYLILVENSSTDVYSYCYLFFIWQFCLLHNTVPSGDINKPVFKGYG